jgi:16S rRNA (uracil1498-N3)-methyltransferase
MVRVNISAAIRLFVTAPLTLGSAIETTPPQAHYLSAVMRRRAGDPIRLFNGRDGEWLAHIEAIQRDRAKLVTDRLLREQVPEPDLWLAFALLKRDATDLVVQKATELGVATIRPVITARTNAGRVNLARLAAIAVEAAEQSERLTVPELHQPQPLAALLASWPTGRRLIVAVERLQAPEIPSLTGAAGLLVGPEGGFDPAELETLRAQPFVIAGSLGPRVLRAETACIAGLALLQAWQTR